MKNINIIICLIISANLYAFDLDIKKDSFDKELFEISPSSQIMKNRYNIYTGFSFLKDPLVLKNGNNVQSLINSDNIIKFGVNYKISKDLMIGLGAKYNQIETNNGNKYSGITSPELNIKYQLIKNLAINPYIGLPMSKDVSFNLDGKKSSIDIGNKSLYFGGKVIYDVMFDKDLIFSTFVDLKKNSKNVIFATVDQSTILSLGLSSLYNITKNISIGNEFVVSETPTNLPMEYTGYFKFSKDNAALKVGVGTADLSQKLANKFQVFANLNISFGAFNNYSSNNQKTYKTNKDDGKNQKIEEGVLQEESKPLIIPIEKVNTHTYISNHPSRGIASLKILDEGVFKTLPNGKKVKVFKNKITQMPTELGVEYITESDYNQKLKDFKKQKIKNVISKENTVKKQINVEPTVLSKDSSSDDKDPVNMIQDSYIIQKDQIKVENNNSVELVKIESNNKNAIKEIITEVINDNKLASSNNMLKNTEEKKNDNIEKTQILKTQVSTVVSLTKEDEEKKLNLLISMKKNQKNIEDKKTQKQELIKDLTKREYAEIENNKALLEIEEEEAKKPKKSELEERKDKIYSDYDKKFKLNKPLNNNEPKLIKISKDKKTEITLPNVEKINISEKVIKKIEEKDLNANTQKNIIDKKTSVGDEVISKKDNTNMDDVNTVSIDEEQKIIPKNLKIVSVPKNNTIKKVESPNYDDVLMEKSDIEEANEPIY